MELSYWQSRWLKHLTGWHMHEVYPHLQTYWGQLELKPNSTVLVPLCGKTLDMQWLIGQGHRVIGIEISELAIREYIAESYHSFQRSSKKSFRIFTSGPLQLWQGDFFKLRADFMPRIDAIYDKAALVALPPEKRSIYAEHIYHLSSEATQIFLNTFIYKQEEMNGPPFSVSTKEIKSLYGNSFKINLLYKQSIPEELSKFRHRGLRSYLIEKIYLMKPLEEFKP